MRRNKRRVGSSVMHATSAHDASDGRIADRACRTLADAGFSVRLAGPGVLLPAAAKAGVTQAVIPRRESRLARMVISPIDIGFTVIRERPDVVHLHDPELLPIGVLLRVLRFSVIYDAHEDLEAQVRDKYWIPSRLRGTASRAARLIEVAAGQFMTSIVAATPTIATKYPAEKVFVVRNLPRLARFQSDTPLIERPPLAVYVGAMSTERGALQLVDAAADLPCGSLRIAGSAAESQLLGKLQRRKGWGNVDYLGTVDLGVSVRLQLDSSVGVCTFLPTEAHLDALPTKLFEYMAAGLAVVASDFPLWRTFLHGCALFVDPLDPVAISDAIQRLLTDTNERVRLGEAGRAAASAGFSWEAEEAQLLFTYAAIGARPGGDSKRLETASAQADGPELLGN